MRILLFILTLLASTSAVHADDFAYLTFEQTDGTKTSLNISDISAISIGAGTLTVGATTFTLTDLSKMYFSSVNESTGIDKTTADVILAKNIAVYNLSGVYIGTFESLASAKESLTPGIYILKNNGKSLKVTVK